MSKIYDVFWNLTMGAILLLLGCHVYFNWQSYINDIYHALKIGGLI